MFAKTNGTINSFEANPAKDLPYFDVCGNFSRSTKHGSNSFRILTDSQKTNSYCKWQTNSSFKMERNGAARERGELRLSWSVAIGDAYHVAQQGHSRPPGTPLGIWTWSQLESCLVFHALLNGIARGPGIKLPD